MRVPLGNFQDFKLKACSYVKIISKTLLCLSVSLALSSCVSGEQIAMPFFGLWQDSAYINATQNMDIAGAPPMARWWTRIDDPLLEDYVSRLLDDNLTLMQAGARVIQAREALNIQAGAYYPSAQGNVSAGRSFRPGVSDRVFTDSYAAELETSWKIDLFGKIRKSVESSRQTFRASLYDLEALKHSLIAELTKRRIGVAVQKRLLELARQNAENRKDFYDLVKRRYDLGAQGVSASDVYLAQENYTSVEADIHQFERLLAEESYALDVLLGVMPGTTDPFASEFPMVTPPLDMPVCLPADLMDRRPDLKSSALRLEAAKADISVAIADLYPSVTLGGALGFSGDTTNNLFSADQLTGSLLGSIITRIFEGGRLRANIRLQEAEARELAAAYAENILNAVREVETSLKAEQELAKELQSSKKSVEALQNAVTFSGDRYTGGIVTLQNLLDIQQRKYVKEQEYIRTQQARWNARIDLYLALGGDWFETNPSADACTGKEEKS
ncbi:MAG: efflux transporter outer membrane subunit [Alphaproteobacteria bacterium]